jgi:hypothetical protein
MTPEKTRRVAIAVGFLSGVLACMDAVRDAGILWPLDALWEGLRSPQRLELGVGIALTIVSFVTSLLPRRQSWIQ